MYFSALLWYRVPLTEFLVVERADRTREATRHSGILMPALLNEPYRHRIAVEFSVAGLDRGDDDEDGVHDQRTARKTKPTTARQKNRGAL